MTEVFFVLAAIPWLGGTVSKAIAQRKKSMLTYEFEQYFKRIPNINEIDQHLACKKKRYCIYYGVGVSIVLAGLLVSYFCFTNPLKWIIGILIGGSIGLWLLYEILDPTYVYNLLCEKELLLPDEAEYKLSARENSNELEQESTTGYDEFIPVYNVKLNGTKLTINSSKVPACSLKIYSDKEKIFEGFLFSREKTEIYVGNVLEKTLKFEWSFALEKYKRANMLIRKDIPSWKLRKQNAIRITNYFDYLFSKLYPNPADGVYMTCIGGMTEEVDDLQLNFRGTKFYKGYTLLDVSSREDDKKLDIHFERRNNRESIKKAAQRRKIVYIFVRCIELLCLFLIGVFLEEHTNAIVIYSFVAFVWKQIHDMRKTLKDMKKYFEKMEEIPYFRETPEEIIYEKL